LESLNFEVLIESGVVCRSLCSAVRKMRFHKMACILFYIKEN
jgi:hypothetical protein